MHFVGKGRYWVTLAALLVWGGYMFIRSLETGTWSDFMYGFLPGILGVSVAVYGIRDAHDGDKDTRKILKEMQDERKQERREVQNAVQAVMGERAEMTRSSNALMTSAQNLLDVTARLEAEWLINRDEKS